MNKTQLISAMADNAEISVAKAEKALSAILDGILQTLTKGGAVSLVGFGSFSTKKRSARKVRNPQTGEEIMLKETNVPFFKVGKKLKDNVDSDSKK